jgi:hypothetical protein
MTELGESADALADRYGKEIAQGRDGLFDHFPLVWYPLCECVPASLFRSTIPRSAVG